MSLTEELQEIRRGGAASMPAPLMDALAENIEDLSRSGISERSLKTGDRVPDFELADIHGQPVRIADLLASGPVVVSFYRGGWCPFCTAEMKALQRALPAITALGASVVAISPQTPDCSGTSCEEMGVDFHVLSDAGNDIANAFGIVYGLKDEMQSVYQEMGLELPSYNEDASWTLPIPATYVVDQTGTIRLAYVDPDYTTRQDPAEILTTLSRLAQEGQNA